MNVIQYGHAHRSFRHSLCDNDRANMAYSAKVTREIVQARVRRIFSRSAICASHRRRPDGGQPEASVVSMRSAVLGGAQSLIWPMAACVRRKEAPIRHSPSWYWHRASPTASRIARLTLTAPVLTLNSRPQQGVDHGARKPGNRSDHRGFGGCRPGRGPRIRSSRSARRPARPRRDQSQGRGR